MTLSAGWVAVIIIVVLAVIISSITTLMKSNKPFNFPDDYENPAAYKDDEEDEGYAKVNKPASPPDNEK